VLLSPLHTNTHTHTHISQIRTAGANWQLSTKTRDGHGRQDRTSNPPRWPQVRTSCNRSGCPPSSPRHRLSGCHLSRLIAVPARRPHHRRPDRATAAGGTAREIRETKRTPQPLLSRQHRLLVGKDEISRSPHAPHQCQGGRPHPATWQSHCRTQTPTANISR